MRKILYFVRGGLPNKQQKAEIAELGALVRNASAFGANDFCEKCDAVAGDAPKAYRAKFEYVAAKIKVGSEDSGIDGMTVKQLQAYAQDKGIMIPETLKSKADILAFVKDELAKLETTEQ